MDFSGSSPYQNTGQNTSAVEESDLPKGSRLLVIITCSIGGVFLFFFIVYVIRRMRKGAALVDVLKLRPRGHASPYMVRPEEYPIYYEQRYSVRSSRYPLSIRSKARASKNLPGLPGPVTQPGAQMSSKPPSIIMEPHMARLKAADNTYLNHRDVRKSQASNVPSISVRSMGDDPTSPASPTRATRWSWTNSEAPSTPRLNIERKRTSNGSLVPNYKPVGFGNNYQLKSIQEDSLSPPLPRSNSPPPPPLPRSNSVPRGGVPGKAQEFLETGGTGYLPPRIPPKAKSGTWKSVFRG
ncbi:hypothetical protein E4T48_03462 [Aureobasidium sp. EXF-10727]|nr:hypothetical protein E4T48_03462 [Aureobasidium sp. EXF-10727]